jgi:hypothetical protein
LAKLNYQLQMDGVAMGTNDKANAVSTETTDREPISPSTETSASEQDNGAGGPIILFFISGLIVSLIIGWVVFPKLLYSQKKQPVEFNHALHNELDDLVEKGCDNCHFFREDGTYSGVPTLAQCIDCHEEVQGEDPEEEKFVNEYVVKGREVPWLIYSRQPDNVFFSHVAHVKLAKMDCATCHGPIGESESLKAYQENRISG